MSKNVRLDESIYDRVMTIQRPGESISDTLERILNDYRPFGENMTTKLRQGDVLKFCPTAVDETTPDTAYDQLGVLISNEMLHSIGTFIVCQLTRSETKYNELYEDLDSSQQKYSHGVIRYIANIDDVDYDAVAYLVHSIVDDQIESDIGFQIDAQDIDTLGNALTMAIGK